jgi:hypothetical protein
MQLIHRIPLRDIAQVLSGIPLGRIKNPMTKTLRLKSEEGIKQYLRMGKGYGINANLKSAKTFNCLNYDKECHLTSGSTPDVNAASPANGYEYPGTT